MIVGTAGHIDHGKSSLVRRLTGIDPDRLKEEKERGITIELGFAYMPRPNGQTIGFVDVPGHERLVHTMLAGATGIDFVLLVVACDDGVMPQTREHIAIIDLLGLKRGVVALTKMDLVDDDRIQDVSAHVRSVLAGTGLEGADIVPVSSVSGAGVDQLMARLDAAALHEQDRRKEDRFRLAVDRVFSLAGAGTVVTGTVMSGVVNVGDTVIVSPSGREARVRSIHAQNLAAQRGYAGQRCALALVGAEIDASSINRGDTVLDPSLHHPVDRLDVRISLLASERKPLSSWLPIKFHHGAAERDGKILALRDTPLRPGETDFAQIVLASPLALASGDRFVIRDAAASRTMGGGDIVDLHPPERRRTTPERRTELAALTNSDVLKSLEGVLRVRGFVELTGFLRDRAAATDNIDVAVQKLNLVTFDAGSQVVAMLPEAWSGYAAGVVQMLEAFHAAQPGQPGISQEHLRLRMAPRLPASVFAPVLRRLAAEGQASLDRSWVRRPQHNVRFSEEEERLWMRLLPLLGGQDRFRPPRVRDIAKLRSIDEQLVRRIFKLAAMRGDVDEVHKDHFFLSGAVIEMADIARDLAQTNSEFSVIAFRDRLDNGRKVAIQILEFFDRQGLTMRRGDIRRINPHKRELFSRPLQPSGGGGRDGGETPPVGRPDFKSGEGRETVLGGFDSCLLRQSPAGARR